MARTFSAATAEQVLRAVEAVVAFRNSSTVQSVAEFADLTIPLATSALELGADLGLLSGSSQQYSISSPLCRLARTPHDKERAAILRIVLELYEPFQVFREELEATGDASEAARRTKQILDLTAHREEIKDTLLSLATFSGALVAGHGGRYSRDSIKISELVSELNQGCEELSAGIQHVRNELGHDAANAVSHDDVITPLATGLRLALAGSPREAVMHAGNAIDSFLDEVGKTEHVSLHGKHGINSKIEELNKQNKMPKKLLNVGKYLGHVRNGADHGVDAEVGQAWDISRATGINFVNVAMSFVRSVICLKQGKYEL